MRFNVVFQLNLNVSLRVLVRCAIYEIITPTHGMKSKVKFKN